MCFHSSFRIVFGYVIKGKYREVKYDIKEKDDKKGIAKYLEDHEIELEKFDLNSPNPKVSPDKSFEVIEIIPSKIDINKRTNDQDDIKEENMENNSSRSDLDATVQHDKTETDAVQKKDDVIEQQKSKNRVKSKHEKFLSQQTKTADKSPKNNNEQSKTEVSNSQVKKEDSLAFPDGTSSPLKQVDG